MVDRVIFACVHSAGRSQIASAWFNAFAHPDRAHAEAAGTQPAARLHPEVVLAMKSEGIDLSARTPQLLTADLARGAKLLITMGCKEKCPVVPGVERDDWPFDDPKGKSPEAIEKISDAIRSRVEKLINARGWR